ncbi:hypothetical protein CcI49_28355 [Frankia sp. CcI49]|uniref:GntR family transcriptional regulator n=1 Tax=Frankia sp. CcI49 TaxID=1745382 RepID=UPI0009762449|nr:GntR family transcriptional regulator [Frankia sp. CcI49]ONH55439.1 hypothetical protein CcI49_28355 [Frankia sp. CcI49]
MAGDSLGRALYLRIADDLRRKITSGDLAPDQRIGSEKSLAADWSTTRQTIREALDVLVAEGLIVRRHGQGSFVRRRPPVAVRWSTRYRRPTAGESSPFAQDARNGGAEPDWTWETQRVRADEKIAKRLGIAAGEYVMRTAYVFRANGQPTQSSTSWEPFALVGGTPIEEPEGVDGPSGVIARMDTIGVHVDRVTEVPRPRPPTEAEQRLLDIPAGIWVTEIERTHWAGDRAVETADIVIPTDRYVLAYEIAVS